MCYTIYNKIVKEGENIMSPRPMALGKIQLQNSCTSKNRLAEYGFWDYTTPAAGGMEHYRRKDYLCLLDDMAAAGMNSLVMVIKWMTTGYRSRLPWLDQEPANAAIASNNKLIRFVIEEAHRRAIKVWLGAVVTEHIAQTYGPTPHHGFTIYVDGQPRQAAVYDLDLPNVVERSVAIFEEIVRFFPQADGLMVEVEGGDLFGPHRIAPYNGWADNHGKLRADNNGNCPAYGEYTVFRRCTVLRQIEQAVRALGFTGTLATICETISGEYSTYQMVNLREFAKITPDYAVVTYNYSRWQRRLSATDYCLIQPREYGLRTYYMARGVMTWNKKWRSPQPKLPMSLPEHWAIDVEDVSRFRPDGFWWFGTGALREGAHVDLTELQRAGFKDGRHTRTQLIKSCKRLAAT
jgi:hypothetical protein